jgi:hypothetical protein
MAGLVQPEFMQVGNPAAPFISAFAAGAAINAKRQALQDQLMKMQMQTQLGEQKLQVQAANYQSLDAARAAHVQDVTTKAENISQHAQDAIDAQNAISNIDAEIGTKTWMQSMNIVHQQFPRYFGTPDGRAVYNQYFDTHKFTAQQMVQGQKAVATDYLKEMSAEKLNPYWMENPDQWVGIDATGKETSDPNKAAKRALKFTTDAQGNLLLASPDTPAKDVKAWKTIPTPRFDQLIKQHEAYKGIVNGIITGDQEPDMKAAVAGAVSHKVKVAGPDGTEYMLPNDQLGEAIKQGYKQVP